MSESVIDIVIKYLEEKSNLTDLEKDIVDSYREYVKRDSDKDDLIKTLVQNKAKYRFVIEERMLAQVQTSFTSEMKPFNDLSMEELKANLYNQILILCTKYKG